MTTTRPNHALQRTRRERRGCSRGVPCAGSLSLGRLGRTTPMATCPHCNTRVSLRTITFALCPIWIVCPACATKLVGGWFIKTQGVIIIVVVATFTVLVMRSFPAWRDRILWLAAGVFVISLVNTVATLLWGRYELRQSRAA